MEKVHKSINIEECVNTLLYIFPHIFFHVAEH